MRTPGQPSYLPGVSCIYDEVQRDKSKCANPNRVRYQTEKSAKNAARKMTSQGKLVAAWFDSDCGYWHIRPTRGFRVKAVY